MTASPAPRSRRGLLRALGTGATAALAGCASFGEFTDRIGRTPPTPPFPSGPKSPPERPADLDEDAATAYAKEYERAVVYNRLHSPGADRVRVDCQTTQSLAERGGRYVLTACRGSATGGGSHADYGRTPTAYLVTDDRTTRIPTSAVEGDDRTRTDAYRASDERENLAADRAVTNVRVYNFDTESRTAYIWADYLGVPGETRIFEGEYRLAPQTGVAVTDLGVRRGRYRVTVALDTGASETRRWTLTRSDSRHRIPFFLVPVGTVFDGTWFGEESRQARRRGQRR